MIKRRHYKELLCVNCNIIKPIICKGLCKNCYQNIKYKAKENNSPLKKCECSPECPIMINSIDKKGRYRRFENGHGSKGENNGQWKGGETTNMDGYRLILDHNHPKTTKRGYIMKHRKIYEEYYNVCLLPWIEIHHINGIVDDNRIENMMPVTKSEHTILEQTIDMSDRQCPNCDFKGKGLWIRFNGIRLCKKCYLREWRKGDH